MDLNDYLKKIIPSLNHGDREKMNIKIKIRIPKYNELYARII